MSKNYLLLFSSKNFIVSGLTFRYLIHLEFIFVYGVRMEKALAPHSSTLAWKIPWAEEPGGLQSMRSLRVRHNWATSLLLFTFMRWRMKWQPTPVFLPGESHGQRRLVRQVIFIYLLILLINLCCPLLNIHLRLLGLSAWSIVSKLIFHFTDYYFHREKHLKGSQ